MHISGLSKEWLRYELKAPLPSGADGAVSNFNLITAPPSRSNDLIARAPRLEKAGNVHLTRGVPLG
jgi:hypothetical protein